MPDYVRVKDKTTGHEYTVRAAHFNPDAHERLDKPALDVRGEPMAPKYRVELGEPPAPSASYARRPERRRFEPSPEPVTPEPVPNSDPEPEPDDGQSAESEEEIH